MAQQKIPTDFSENVVQYKVEREFTVGTAQAPNRLSFSYAANLTLTAKELVALAACATVFGTAGLIARLLR